jgi:hypothetical protein
MLISRVKLESATLSRGTGIEASLFCDDIPFFFLYSYHARNREGFLWQLAGSPSRWFRNLVGGQPPEHPNVRDGSVNKKTRTEINGCYQDSRKENGVGSNNLAYSLG